jgi:hypothetical protein
LTKQCNIETGCFYGFSYEIAKHLGIKKPQPEKPTAAKEFMRSQATKD